MINTTNTTLVSLAGMLVLAFQYFGWVVPQDAILTVLAGLVTLYGIIKQHTNGKTLTAQVNGLLASKGLK